MAAYNERIFDLIKDIGDSKIDVFEALGHAEAGHNGPYGHKDSPARNTAHWLIIYSFLWKKTGYIKYKNIAYIFATYLRALQKKSDSGAVMCMLEDKFNHLNGLIGQAWVIESLLFFSKTFNEKKYVDIAKEIFLSQKYNKESHMWELVELDGENIGYDYTFNHQLWFAAVGSMFFEFEVNSEIIDMVYDYLQGCKKHMQIRKDGLIKHYGDLEPKNEDSGKFKREIKRYVKKCIFNKKRYINPTRFDPDGYERAYHLFNLYAFAILKNNITDNDFFENNKLLRALDYGRNINRNNDYFNVFRAYRDEFPGANMNKYAYGYNSPAFEFPYIYKTFGCDNLNNICEELMQIQIDLTYDEKNKSFAFHNEDSETLTARIYELIRFIDE